MLRLMGVPRLEQGEQVRSFEANKTLLLLAYLACKPEWVSRAEVAALIWPEADSSTRLTRLRQMLRYMQGKGWFADVEVERNRLRWSQGSDVHELSKAFAEDNWQEVVRLYRGPLLAELSLEQEEPYARWLVQERQRHRNLWLDAARKAALGLEGQGRITESLEVWEAILREDSLAESALCEVMRLCLSCGQYARGFAAYTGLQQRLWAEHKLEPHPNTHAWLERLREAAANTGSSAPTTSPPAAAPNLPFSEDILPGIPFVGREGELEELLAWLDSEAAGLWTLYGPGGVGKTRLALEATRRSSCPAVFVPLISLLKGQSVMAAVAQAMGKPLRSLQNAEQELKAGLQGNPQVLVLDNAEHLIEEIKPLVLLLEGLPEVKLLITSRLPMGLEHERLMEISGLSLEAGPADFSPALSLLFYAVRRTRAGFVGSSYETEVASRICQILGGVPLALELAGGWAKLFSLSEIEKRIQEKLDFLEGSLETSERHRGLRVVFAQSWQLLSGSEQRALCRLAIFEQGFEVKAGLEVAQVAEQDLLALVDKAMVRMKGQTVRRGEIHPLIQAYAREQLIPIQRQQIRERHAQYFLRFAEEAKPNLIGPEQFEWMERIALEHPNLRLALRWWIEAGKAEGALKLVHALAEFWNVRGHFWEGLEWFNQATAMPDAQQHLREYAAALNSAALFATGLGDYARAKDWLLQALGRWQQIGDPASIAQIHQNLGFVTDDLQEARNYLQASIEVRRTLNDADGLAASLNILGINHAKTGELNQARALFEESLTLAEAVGNHKFIASAYTNLGVLAQNQNRPFEEVEQLYLKSLEIRRKLGDLLGVGIGYHNLGVLALKSNQVSARRYLSESLSVRYKLGNRALAISVLFHFAQLLTKEGEFKRAAMVYGFWCKGRTPGPTAVKIEPEAMDTLEQQLTQALGSEPFASAQASGRMLSLEQVLRLTEETRNAI